MKFINTKYITIGILTLFLGVLAAYAGAKVWFDRSTTVQGKTTAFILNPEGKIDGAVLETGDQIHFGAETGEIISQQIKIGDVLSATGHAGTKSDYGRELRAESLQIGDQTITVVNSKPRPPRDERGPKPHPGDDRKSRRGSDDRKMPPPPADANAPKPQDAPRTDEADAQQNELRPAPPVAPADRQTVNAGGRVQIVLVGGRGEARGLILSSGEQVELPREVEKANLTLSQETEVSVEGETAKANTGGVFIHPLRLTIGNQTFSFNR